MQEIKPFIVNPPLYTHSVLSWQLISQRLFIGRFLTQLAQIQHNFEPYEVH